MPADIVSELILSIWLENSMIKVGSYAEMAL